jgi:endonuclease YncB( thermonuclease family)
MASTDPVRREFASRVVSGLRELTVGKNVYFTVEYPPKGLDGRLLVIAHLSDGTELNRLALESGMAVLALGDFPKESAADELVLAERDARKNKRGFWAH